MDSIIQNFVNDSMFIIYTARPVSRKCMFKWLRFSDSFKRIALNFFDQRVDSKEDFFIGFLPIKVVLPCMIRGN
ncbi:MAG: hypothetical protein VR64_07715 [Desulfatitalea sp. BRH_c12]|nr:MAG: hypothetical protein VR64_07715 [Desulfatitalea sp. BRH_c12]